MWGRVKELFRIPALAGMGADKGTQARGREFGRNRHGGWYNRVAACSRTLILRPCPHPSHAAPLPILAASTLGAGSIPTKLKWTVLTDRSIGGKSEASFEVLPVGDGVEEEEEDVGAGAMTKTERRIPLAVFSGQLSTVRPSADPKYVFCGLRRSR